MFDCIPDRAGTKGNIHSGKVERHKSCVKVYFVFCAIKHLDQMIYIKKILIQQQSWPTFCFHYSNLA